MIHPRPSITSDTAINSDLQAGDCIRIVHWLGRDSFAILGPYNQVAGFTDDPNFGKEEGIRVVPNLNMVNAPIRVDAIAYPLAMITCVHPGKASHTTQVNVTAFECVKIPAHYFEAVRSRGVPTFELWQSGEMHVSWLTTLVTSPTPHPAPPPPPRKPGLLFRLLLALAPRIIR